MVFQEKMGFCKQFPVCPDPYQAHGIIIRAPFVVFMLMGDFYFP
jgi:hypothetical protein